MLLHPDNGVCAWKWRHYLTWEINLSTDSLPSYFFTPWRGERRQRTWVRGPKRDHSPRKGPESLNHCVGQRLPRPQATLLLPDNLHCPAVNRKYAFTVRCHTLRLVCLHWLMLYIWKLFIKSKTQRKCRLEIQENKRHDFPFCANSIFLHLLKSFPKAFFLFH